MNLISETPIRRLLAVGGVVLAGSVALSGCSLLADAANDDTSGTEVSGEQVDAVAEAKAGDCLPEEMLSQQDTTFTVPCDDPTAFWTLTAIEADSTAVATTDGSGVVDPQPVYDLCGEQVNAQVPGATWTDYSMIYNPSTYEVDYLFCVEALGNPSAEGATPTVPANAGECTLSTTEQWNYGVFDCAAGDSTISSVISVDQAEWATVNPDDLAMECTGSSYMPGTDQFGRTAAVFCLE
jgi:hypothetical protein